MLWCVMQLPMTSLCMSLPEVRNMPLRLVSAPQILLTSTNHHNALLWETGLQIIREYFSKQQLLIPKLYSE